MARARRRHRFAVGDIIHYPAAKKFYRVERLKTIHGMRYLLRSLEAGNPGTPKSGAYIDNQLAEGVFILLSAAQYERATR